MRLPEAGTLDPRVVLVDSTGTEVADEDGAPNDGHFIVNLAADGVYYAQVAANAGAGELGQYLLDVVVTDLVPPVVVSTGLPGEGTTTGQFINSFQVEVSEDLEAATVNAVSPRVWSYGGRFYQVTDSSLSWADAEVLAQSLGGHVVTINDAAEQAWVHATFSRFGSLWIGMTDQVVEGTWVWGSGEAVSYTNWASGQPQSNSSYDWAYLNSLDGQWYVTSGSRRAIIEFDAVDGDGDGVPDALDVYPSDPWNAWDLRAAGNDGVFDTVDDQRYPLTVSPAYSAGTQVGLFIEGGPLGSGQYRFTANATLEDRAGNALDGNDDGTGGDAYQQFFTVALPGGLVFEGDNNDTQATATALPLVEDPPGSGYYVGRGQGLIDPAPYNSYSESDWWRFEALAGDRVSVSMDTPDSVLDPYVYLYDAAGTNVAADESGGPDQDAFISRYVIPTSGTYYVRASKDRYHQVPDSYHLRVDLARGIELESDAHYSNDSVGGANTLTLVPGAPGEQTATVAGTVMGPESSNTDEDRFGWGTANAGNMVELNVRLPEAGTLDPRVVLVDSTGTEVADEDGAPNDGHFIVNLAADGVYYAQVAANAGAGELGQYLLDVVVTDLVPPVVVSTGLPGEGTTTGQFINSFQVEVSEDLEAATVNAVSPRVWSYGGRFYQVTDSSLSWADAEVLAQSLGGHVVTINDAAEQAWVHATFSRFGSLWIGMTDQVVEGTWVWGSGEAVSYTNWASGQPQSNSSYDWAYLNSLDGQWYVTSGSRRAIIEFDAVDGDGDGVPDALDVYPSDPWNAWDLRAAGNDGVFDTVDDQRYPLTVSPAYSAGTQVGLFIEGGPLGSGQYRFTANATLEDRAGNALDGNDDGTGGDAYQQFFTVALPGGLVFEGDNNDTQATATALPLVEDPPGSGYYVGRGQGLIDPAPYNSYSESDWWRFEALAGDRVSVSMDTPDSVLDPYVYLYDAAGTNVAADESGGPDQDAFISRYVIPTSGTYYVRASKDRYHQVPDSYHLRVDLARGIELESDAHYSNDSVGGANTLTLVPGAPGEQTATVAGTVMGPESSNTDEDRFGWGTANAGNMVELNVRLPEAGTLDPRVVLVDSTGTEVADEDGAPNDGHFIVNLAADGVYYAQVAANAGAGELGQYLLDVVVTDLVPPVVVSTGLPGEGTTTGQFINSFQVEVSEDLEAATVNAVSPRVWSYGGRFYQVTDSSLSWADAEVLAQSLGGHVVTINDAAEQAWVHATFSRFGSLWIGMTDQVVEGTWVWGSGEAVSYTNWASGQPQSNSSYDWAYLNSLDGQWYVTSGSRRAIIEFDAVDGDGDGVPDALDVYPSDPWNAWDLRAAGNDGVFDTVDDQRYPLTVSPAYSAGTQVGLFIEGGPLGSGQYRFTANATLEDRAGNALDGNDDGTGGDAYQQFFTVALPGGLVFEGDNNDTQATATALPLVEDPPGSGYYVGRGQGLIDPAPYNSYSESDWWRFEALAGDRVSVSMDTPDSVLDPYVYLYDAGGVRMLPQTNRVVRTRMRSSVVM